ncbi:hypothetical protein KSP39_PZI001088 [Platanthera zijinensis]|uniref:Uncharacterized protein n=1 Tax=Platanthera zijinensis TaxID=2320716 RepID=A0AAP0C4Z0_9ASPA
MDKLQFTAPKNRKKFEEVWMSNPDVYAVAQGGWMIPVEGNLSKILAVKSARAIKAPAHWCNFDAKAETEKARKLEKKINAIQLLEGQGPLSDDDLSLLRALVFSYNEVQTEIEAWWWQRAKSNWLQHGDRNSAFFHAAATQRKHGNHIFSLALGETTITDQELIEE